MKRLFTKLMLVLLLVVNPMAGLAVDFHNLEINADQTTSEAPCDAMEQQLKHSQPTQHDSKNCEMPCCEDYECAMQDICFVQHNSDFATQIVLKFSLTDDHRGWGSFIAVVPDRELAPDTPPPIHL